MTRNSDSHFSVNPTNLDIRRSRFQRNSGHKTTFNTGDLIPIFVDEILPGDTVTMDINSIVRMSTPIFPVMDNAFLDVYFFFVPNRLVWEHWKEFNGENTQSHWAQETEYEIPQIQSIGPMWRKGSIADYMGIPTEIEGISVNHLPFRAYCLIWNEWFRDQNLQDPCYINKDDTTLDNGYALGDYVLNAQRGHDPLKVNKFHDYFTSALPQPQKGPSVLLPLGSFAPVMAKNDLGDQWGQIPNIKDADPLRWKSSTALIPGSFTPQLQPISPAGPPMENNVFNTIQIPATAAAGSGNITPANLWTDLSSATAATINELRLAFQIQRLFEKDARGGTRYTEIIKSHFGVTSPDSRQQRPEYLGGHRVPISMDQVLQTSETNSTPQGNTAAYSLTGQHNSLFTKSFTEHGYLLGLCCVRTSHTYQQGIERLWNRKRRFDFYWPALANIGEQAILNKEIYAQGNDVDDAAFGYQEAWAEYRYKPNRISGEFRSTYAQPLDAWHYADYYESQPFLSKEWMFETHVNVERTLATTTSLNDQFIADFLFQANYTRAMPIYSIPGLIDHH